MHDRPPAPRGADLTRYRERRDFRWTPEPTGDEPLLEQLYTGIRTPAGVPGTYRGRYLAIETEDHPLAYLAFEGVIPEGNYGAGTVELWDWGYYLPQRFDADKVVVALMGHRVAGGYELVRTRGDHWLLFRLAGS